MNKKKKKTKKKKHGVESFLRRINEIQIERKKRDN